MKISIYLEDNLLDTNEDSIVSLTLCYSYVEDPTTIAGDYSKTISIPGTVNNNRIFGQIWNIDREILNSDTINTGIYFNASKRTETKIFMDHDLFKKGYVQLNNISRTNDKITYEITFYSELCNMLHTIMDSSLGSLNFPGKLSHVVNAGNILFNVNNNGPTILNTSSSLSDYVKYGLSIDGVFENFNASKWMTWDSTNSKYVIADIDDNGTNYDTAMIFQSPSNRIRPYIRISSLLNQIRDDYNSVNDIKLSYSDPYFFNSSNPYVSNLVLSGKTYDTESNSSGTTTLSFEDFSVDYGNQISIKASGDYADLNGIIDLSSLSVVPDITLECMLAFNGTLNNDTYQKAIASSVYSSGRQFTIDDSIVPEFCLYQVDDNNKETGVKYYFKMKPFVVSEHTTVDEIYLGQDKDEHNTVLTPLIYETTKNTATFDIAFKNCVFRDVQSELDCTTNPCKYVEKYVYDKRYTNLVTFNSTSDVDQFSNDNNDNQGVTDFFPFKFSASNIAPGKYILKVKISYSPEFFNIRDYTDYSFGDSTIDIPMTSLTMRGRFNTTVGTNGLVNGNSSFIYRNRQPMQSFIANTLSETTVTTTSGNNMYLSTGSGTVPGATVSFSDMVDTETTQGDLLVNYAKIFGLLFDTDTVNDDNTIRICSRNYYHKDYQIIDWTDKIDYSQSFKQVPLTFNTKFLSMNYNDSESYYATKYASTYDTSYGVQLIDTGYEFNNDTSTLISNQLFNQVIPVKNEGRFKGIAPGFFTKDNNERSPIDGIYSLLFWDDNTYKPNIFVYDDCSIFHDEDLGGDENMSFVDTSSLFEHGAVLDYKEINLPAPQVLYSSNSGIVSTDIGYPRANFAGYSVSTYPSSGTIYSSYWDNYIRNLYDINTQIITVYVYLKPIEILNFSFKNFIKIKDTLWHPNKITDYNPLSNKPVQVELVKVQDINAFVNSSIKWYEYFKGEFNVFTNDESIKASALLTPNSGGIITGSTANQYYGDYLYGTQWTQSFSYVQPYNSIDSVEAFYYDELGVKQDCSSWFNPATLTFTCNKVLPSDVTVNIKVIESGVSYYSVSTELENTVLTWINPTQEVTRIRQGSTIKATVSSAYPDDDSYKFGSCLITENNINKTSSYFNEDTMTINIPSVSGNIIISCSYQQFDDVLLPWLGSGDVSGAAAYFNTGIKPVFNNIGIITKGSYTGNSTSSWKSLVSATNVTSSGGLSLGIKMCKYDISTTATNISAALFNGYSSYRNSDSDSNLRYYELSASKARYQVLSTGTTNYGFVIDQYRSMNPLTINSSSTTCNNYCLLFAEQHNSTGVITSYNDLRMSFMTMTDKAGTPYANFIPMMHYGDYGYYPCMYDVYNDKYIQATYSQNLEYDLDGNSDIPLMWIGSTTILDGSSSSGSNGSCYFDTGISMHEFTDSSYGFDINFSMHNTNYTDTYTLFHTAPEIVEMDDEGRHCLITNRVDVTDSIPTMYYGSYNSGTAEVPSYEMFSMKKSYNVERDIPTRISVVPFSNTVSYRVSGNSEDGDKQLLKCGSSNVFLFKNVNNYTAPQGIRLYSFGVFSFYSSTNDNTCECYLVPVLHFNGDKTEYYSNEGIKIPLGYTPCLYDMVSKKYIYANGGIPTFGFKHNS